MVRRVTSTLALAFSGATACRAPSVAAPAPAAAPALRAASAATAPVLVEPREVAAPPSSTRPPREVALAAPPRCEPPDWSPRSLPPLLKPGKQAAPGWLDQRGVAQSAFARECTDAPGPGAEVAASPAAVVVEGVEIRLASARPAGSSGRGWAGNHCSFDVRLADGSGPAVHLDATEIPPFTTITALARAGSAVWLGVSFNGYTREFPGGGNRIVAVDLCEGRVVWQSRDSTSNGGLLLVGDYLISPYGFTSERRHVQVLDARSGREIQKLPVVENVCPSRSWAPHHHPGDRCDAPGQRVGAATDPRIEGGLFLVDTNTGSAAFELLPPPPRR